MVAVHRVEDALQLRSVQRGLENSEHLTSTLGPLSTLSARSSSKSKLNLVQDIHSNRPYRFIVIVREEMYAAAVHAYTD
jgi:hypothetical protein